MLKAMLVVTALGGGGGDYTAEMPSMKECLDARIVIAEQDPNVKTLCVPMANETAKMQELFGIFMDMIDQIRAEEEEETTSFDEYMCDSSVEPGVVIQTLPPRINCDEEFMPEWLKEDSKKKE
jgi:hypothetical protein|tara:strand:+ start:339 stop:707 length:369 start_codon:yes stop_codon:yes gene_type:complete